MPRGKPSGLPFNARFTDVAREAGLTQPSIYGGVDTKRYIVEVVGCGVAFLDYDNDGWLDVLVLSGTRLEDAPPTATNRLYRNNRDGTFTDVTEKAGLTRTGWASSVTVGDFDNDGFDDLFITGYGYDALYRNNGDGTFTDVTAKAGLVPTAVRYGSGCTWIDYDRDGRLDLLVARYLDTTIEKLPKPGESGDCRWKGVPVNCGPRGLPTGFVQLFHNNGDGTFTDVSRASGVAAAAKSYPMTTVVADYDTTAGPTSTWRAIRPRAGCSAISATARSGKRRSSAAWRSARTAWSRPAWASPPATSTSTAASICSRRTSPTTPTGCIAATARASSTT